MAYSIPTQITPPKHATVHEVAQAITPTNNTPIGPYVALYVGGFGDVVVCMRNGDGMGGVTTVKFVAVPSGTWLPIAIQGVNATGTTASNLVGLA